MDAIAEIDDPNSDCQNVRNWSLHYAPSLLAVDLLNTYGGGLHEEHEQQDEFPDYHIGIGEGPTEQWDSGSLAYLIGHEVIHHLYPHLTEQETEDLAEQCSGHQARVW